MRNTVRVSGTWVSITCFDLQLSSICVVAQSEEVKTSVGVAVICCWTRESWNFESRRSNESDRSKTLSILVLYALCPAFNIKVIVWFYYYLECVIIMARKVDKSFNDFIWVGKVQERPSSLLINEHTSKWIHFPI